MKGRFVASVLLATILVVAGAAHVFAYSSRTNIYVGKASNECSTEENPYITETFNQKLMITETDNGNQWSAQVNAYPYTNSYGLDFMQFNMAVDTYGEVYGAVELWTPSGGSVWDMHTSTLATATNDLVNSGDKFTVELFQADGYNSGNLWAAEFTYYNAYSGNTYEGTIDIPSTYYAQAASSQLNTWEKTQAVIQTQPSRVEEEQPSTFL